MRIFLTLIFFFFSSCIKAPVEAPNDEVISSREMQIISHVRSGKEYAKAGRMDVAEVEFRKVIRLKEDYAVAYNDLGYVLQAQNRNLEAIAAYKKALELDPSSLIYRNNYSRALYADGQIELAVKNYLELVSLYQEREKPPEEFSLVEIYRNISTAYYVLGNTADALCYSELARITYPTQEITAQHIRLLLSENRTKPVIEIVRGALTVHGDNIMSELLLDYAIGLYVEDNIALSGQAFSKLLARSDVDFLDLQLSRLLKLDLAEQRGDKQEVEVLKESIFEVDKDFCNSFPIDSESYWPYRLVENVQSAIKELCVS